MKPKVKVIDESGKVHHIPREVLEGRWSEPDVHVHIHVHGLEAILSDERSQEPAKNRSKSKRANPFLRR